MFNLRLIVAVSMVFGVLLVATPMLYAQDVRALPVPAVEQETLPRLGKAPVVVELFSSQACVFCPRADRLFADLLRQDNVIGLACHVDYFDVSQGSLSRSFCTKRQDWYMETLAAGPNYTPQMVINGEQDIVAYKFDKVVAGLQQAAYSEILPMEISETRAKGTWRVILPLEKLPPPETMRLWLALYDKPHALTIADGRNAGQKAVYYNIVSSLGSTTELNEEVFVTPPLEDGHAGFVVLLQDVNSSKIYAVARHRLKI